MIPDVTGSNQISGRGRPKDAPVWSDADVLIAESAAFLGGWAPDLFAGRDLPVPGWAWLNPVIHQDLEQVALIARDLETGGTAWGSWEWAAGSIACLALEVADGDPERLRRLQRHYLMPLELTLIERADCPVTSPSHLLALASESLRDRPSVRRYFD